MGPFRAAVLAGLLAAAGCGDDDDAAGGDADADTDADADADADGDGDGDGDGDADCGGASCEADEGLCVGGECVCGNDPACEGTPTSRCCAAGCADTQVDPENCGVCEVHCAEGDECQGGQCACVPGNPAGLVDVWGCECGDGRILGYDCDVVTCDDPSDCTAIEIDPCCHSDFAAVRVDRAFDVESEIGECETPDVRCALCPGGLPDVSCVLGRCAFERPACIALEEAERIAVQTVFPDVADPGAEQVLLSRGSACGEWLVGVCDLNPACTCEADRGWVVLVGCEGDVDAQGALNLCAPGDDCDDAIPIEIGMDTPADTTWSGDGHDASCLDGDTGRDVFFSLTPPISGYLQVSIDAPSGSRSVSLIGACESEEIACSSIGPRGGGPSAGACVSQGDTVHAIVSDGAYEDRGPVTLSTSLESCAVSCDDDLGCLDL